MAKIGEKIKEAVGAADNLSKFKKFSKLKASYIEYDKFNDSNLLNINSNGVCTNTLIGGDSGDVVSSSGNCDDHLTGGNAADKFICGEGTDVIMDYNVKEGDTI